MEFLCPEPVADVVAQINAALDPLHPKPAAFVVPGNVVPGRLPPSAHVVSRPEGTLITLDAALAAQFAAGADDATMAAVLGYPESKLDVIRNCAGDCARALAVQARDAEGNVVSEALCSPSGLSRTVAVMSAHVPAGGQLKILTPTAGIERRLMLRAAESVNHTLAGLPVQENADG